MKHSGTFYLSENATDVAQLVYCSMHDKCLLGMYLQFYFENGKPVKGTINLINYSDTFLFQINEASLSWDITNVPGKYVFANNHIPCISLIVAIEKTTTTQDEAQKIYSTYSLEVPNISGDYDGFMTEVLSNAHQSFYLEVKNKDDDYKDSIEEPSYEPRDKCKDIEAQGPGTKAPGRICPRSYSQLILSS